MCDRFTELDLGDTIGSLIKFITSMVMSLSKKKVGDFRSDSIGYY